MPLGPLTQRQDIFQPSWPASHSILSVLICENPTHEKLLYIDTQTQHSDPCMEQDSQIQKNRTTQ